MVKSGEMYLVVALLVLMFLASGCITKNYYTPSDGVSCLDNNKDGVCDQEQQKKEVKPEDLYQYQEGKFCPDLNENQICDDEEISVSTTDKEEVKECRYYLDGKDFRTIYPDLCNIPDDCVESMASAQIEWNGQKVTRLQMKEIISNEWGDLDIKCEATSFVKLYGKDNLPVSCNTADDCWKRFIDDEQLLNYYSGSKSMRCKSNVCQTTSYLSEELKK